MDQCLRCLCCCFDFQTPPRPRPTRKTRKPAKQYRLNTKYQKQDFVRIEDQQRKAGRIKAYACPICTYYYNRILSCSECINCICYQCFESYDQKNVQKNSRMKCPFCSSTKSIFSDYELDPHSYFDTTNKGFLSKQERLKIDNQFKPNHSVQLAAVPERSEHVMEEVASEP